MFIREVYSKEYRMKYKDEIAKRAKEFRKKNREKIKEYYRSWYQHHGRNRAKNYEIGIRNWETNHPGASRAHGKIAYAIESGKIIKPILCTDCHEERRLSAHHEDYSKPLEVLWLCSSCHKLKHKKVLDNVENI